MTLVRVRQHVNPLSQRYQVATPAPAWDRVFQHPLQPLHVDIGCAKGHFLLAMAQQNPTWNYLGMEIRQPLVDQANLKCQQLGLTNLHFLFCNVNTSLASILAPGAIAGATVQFPDPWFKRRHQKRRVVQPQFLDQLSRCLQGDGFLFVQSDVLAVAQEMVERIDAHPHFTRRADSQSWLPTNPFQVMTERERVTLDQGKPVYRCWFDHQGSQEMSDRS
ncbi:tRNA (guanosine(46)-N7)-methyltransferase TrmB [Lyngbya confervoides]|uniref:tRNA (guanine-N(7)-)-methyltransferase n=1 Tax=Lyngbya confervoides BDU141951 TaxID=1574623 RepID=A0ABD4T1X9_9CYAN|nr:tRNA (guanosine(46)-N7)-methyltransferase TrmB [Lyngbya confervoides]MCM1982683.1 tRNA (guanosine(46)-N7)-methyltransferase TrmB [Lyngbya confervoides BDU141951]